MFHSLRWLSPALRRLVTPRPRHKPPTARPRLEVLEDRAVPATLRVNFASDFAVPDEFLTLREAIDIVNAGNTTGRSQQEMALVTGQLGSNDVIELNLAGTITLDAVSNFSIRRSCTINHTGGELTIRGNSAGIFHVFSTADSVTINGGTSGLTLDGGSQNFCIANVTNLTLDRLTIRNGMHTANGGGVTNSGNLTVTNSTFFSNVSAEGGGAIFNTGSLTVQGCTFEANHAADGGAIFTTSKATISASTFAGNQAEVLPASGVVGAAIRHTPTDTSNLESDRLVVDHCTFVDNRATQAGGAAIYSDNGELATVRKSVLTGNTVTGGVLSDLATGGSDFNRNFVNGNVLNQPTLPPGTNFKNNLLNISRTEAFGQVPALAFNGGPTRTFAPITTVGSGKNITPSNPPVPDQRGGPFGAIDGVTRDPGATEFTRDLTVDTLTDVVDGNYLSGQLSLREAIGIANADPGANRITFDEKLAGTIRLTNGELFITGSSLPTLIIGPGADKLTIDAQDNSRVLQVDFGAVAELAGLTLTNGKASAGLPVEGGGAILNRGFLEMTDVLVTSSTVASPNGGGGGIFNTPAAVLFLARVGIHGNTAPQSFGGGLLNEGTATIFNSSVVNNAASGIGIGGGGGIDNGGTLTLNNSSVLNNSATEFGGGILNAGTMTVLNTTVAGNSAFLGAGIYTEDFAEPPFAATTLTNTLVAGNVILGPTPNDLAGKNVASASKNNLIGDANSAGGLTPGTNGNIVGVADLTTVLAFSGGNLQALKNGAAETLSIALVENLNNLAIDAGDDTAAAGLTNDQSNARARKIGAHVDIGAFEQSFAAPEVVKSVDPDLTFEVQFDEAVTGVDATDFRLVTTGTATAAITNITGSGDEYFVTVQVTGDGQVTLNIADDNSIVDAVITPLGGPAVGDGDFTGTPEAIDPTAPTLLAANIDDNDVDNVVSVGTPLLYTLTFSEDLDASSVTAADFDNAGTATVAITVAAENEPGVVRVQVTPTTAGSVILRIPTGAEVLDVAGNALVVPVQDADTVQARAFPTNLVVDTTADVDDGNYAANNLSLREAVFIANTRPDADSITFAPGLGPIDLTVGALTVTDGGTTIHGGLGGTVIRRSTAAATNFRLFTVADGGSLTLDSVTLANGNGADGGAVRVDGFLILSRSTLRDNTTATNGGALLVAADGVALVTDSTFSGNTSTGGMGGAIFNAGTLSLTHCTIANNSAMLDGGGIRANGPLTLANTIVAGNNATDISRGNAPFTVNGANIVPNLVADGAAPAPTGTGTILTVDPQLQALANQGGPTETLALLPTSPALDAGVNAAALDPFGNPLTTDQRGRPRPVGANVDIGAYETGVRASLRPGTSITEGNSGTTSLVFTLELSEPAPTGGVAILPFTFDITATAGVDYVARTTNEPPVTIAAGATTATFAITINGDTSDEPDETFAVAFGLPAGSPLEFGFPFDATGTIANDDGTVLAARLGGPVSQSEGNSGATNFVFTVNLSAAAPAGGATVQVSTGNGSATAGSDYTASTNQSVVVATGQTSATFTVAVSGDTSVENDETFTVTLTLPAGSPLVLGTPTTATGTITNDDAAQALTVNLAGNVSVTEGNSGTVNAVFTVNLSAPAPAGGVTVLANTAPGTATAPDDYAILANASVFIPGSGTAASVTAVVSGDTSVEADETFTLSISLPQGSPLTLGTVTRATATITNDDQPATGPQVNLGGAVSQTELYTGITIFPFSLTLSQPAPTGGATVLVSTQDGTAAGGTDFLPLTNVPVLFTAGQSTATVSVFVSSDVDVEADETFTVRLSLPANSPLSLGTTANQTGTIRNDDAALTGTPTQQFVQQSFLRTLNAPADGASVLFWDGILSPNPSAKQQFVQILQGTPQGRRVQLDRLYFQYIDRPIDEGGFVFWSNLINLGRVNIDQVGGFVIGSPEFLQRVGGTAQAFADQVVQRATGRPRNPTDPAITTNLLDATLIDITGDGRIDAADVGYTQGYENRFFYALAVNGGDGRRQTIASDQFSVDTYYRLAGVPRDSQFNELVNVLQNLSFYPLDDDVVYAIILAKRTS